MEVSLTFWIVFTIAVVALLFVDLLVFNREAHEISLTEATWWSIFWIALALTFNVGVWLVWGSTHGATFLAGYLLEKSLSVDNLFVFSLLFTYFGIPDKYQHRVLFWGIFGALVMRGLMIFAGVALVQRFEWVFYIFGAFLVMTGVRMLLRDDSPSDPSENSVLRYIQNHLPVTSELHGQKFLIARNGTWALTPLFLVLVMIELTDLVFALDSIPAVLGITREPFIVYTSNVMAILGLRALYFVLGAAIRRFQYLDHGVSTVLIFIGSKMVAEQLGLHVPLVVSLSVIIGVLIASILLSLREDGIPDEEESESIPEVAADSEFRETAREAEEMSEPDSDRSGEYEA